MKPYLLPIFALLIVGCGNQHQQHTMLKSDWLRKNMSNEIE